MLRDDYNITTLFSASMDSDTTAICEIHVCSILAMCMPEATCVKSVCFMKFVYYRYILV